MLNLLINCVYYYFVYFSDILNLEIKKIFCAIFFKCLNKQKLVLFEL